MTCDFSSMMKMYFHFDSCQRLLFSSWEITSDGQLIGAMVAVFLMAVLYEGLKTFREWLLYWDLKKLKEGGVSVSKDSEKIMLVEETAHSNKVKAYSISITVHVIQSLLHVVQIGYGYVLMLVVMTFNGWLFLSVCFGAGAGYLIFAKTRLFFSPSVAANKREMNEHCH